MQSPVSLTRTGNHKIADLCYGDTMTKEIELTQGKIALVDDEDYEKLIKYTWRTYVSANTCYALRHMRVKDRWTTERMHRDVLGLKYKDGKEVDHINRNGLDNRKENLRIVSHQVNMCNHGGFSHNTSGYNGVRWNKWKSKWQARIKLNGKSIHLGYYDDISDAIEARKQGELEHWGTTLACA